METLIALAKRPLTQCAAVKTSVGEMRVPPQKKVFPVFSQIPTYCHFINFIRQLKRKKRFSFNS